MNSVRSENDKLKKWNENVDLWKKYGMSETLAQLARDVGKELVEKNFDLPALTCGESILSFTFKREKLRFCYLENFDLGDKEELDLVFTEKDDPTKVHNIIFPLDQNETIAKQIVAQIKNGIEKYK